MFCTMVGALSRRCLNMEDFRTKKWRYPRTPHLPWSEGVADDDVRASSTAFFEQRRVVVTEKLDGENTTLYSDAMHARSLDSQHHPSRSVIKQLHCRIRYQIPENWRLCGENVYARHSIAYENLKGYFYLFSVWNESNVCLGWDETLLWAERLGMPTPDVLFEGEWNEQLLRSLTFDKERSEGYVVRLWDSFAYEDFGRAVAKCVRKGHVRSEQHWMHADVVPNTLGGGGGSRDCC